MKIPTQAAAKHHFATKKNIQELAIDEYKVSMFRYFLYEKSNASCLPRNPSLKVIDEVINFSEI